MLKNYFTIAINNLIKNKLYSAINIIGLSIGLAAFLLITLYVKDELSFDKQWENADNIYRINKVINYNNSPQGPYPRTSPALLPALKKYFPDDIEIGTLIYGINEEIKIEDRYYQENIAEVDKDFLKIFNLDIVNGSLENTLKAPDNIALSEQTAIKYFGKKEPVGEVVTISKKSYKVTAVYNLISSKTVLNIPCFILRDESTTLQLEKIWGFSDFETYIRFSKTTEINKIIEKLPDFVDDNIPTNTKRLAPGKKVSDVIGYSFQKIGDIYFAPFISDPFWQSKVGNMKVITVYIIISIIVLSIGCINFIILTTANATKRAREVAIRKAVGARFRQLIFQFLGESVIITFLAFLIAVGIVEFVLPFFELWSNLVLTVPYSSLTGYIFALLLIILVGLGGGLYPAFVISGFLPAQVLKTNKTSDSAGSFRLKNILVVFQFTASIVLTVAAVVAYFQLQFTANLNPGFNPENLIVVEGIDKPDVKNHIKTFQQELLKLPEVVNVCLSSRQPRELNGGVSSFTEFRPESGDYKDKQIPPFDGIFVDYNFFKTYEIPLLSGRYFSSEMDHEVFREQQNTTQKEKKIERIIINKTATRELGYKSENDAVGQYLLDVDAKPGQNKKYSIIGVIDDSQYSSLRTKPNPTVYNLIPPFYTYFLTVRFQGDYQTVVKEVERIWHNVVGETPFRSTIVKQSLAEAFLQEKIENNILIIFTLLAIFIACMGLFGMTSFTVDRRAKEIGIRKVMGAKVKDIVKLLSWQFLKPVILANIIAWPMAIFAMQSWLERFPYRFNQLLMIPICLVSGLIALAIAWFTVAGNTTRVAKSKPIKALRYE